MTDREMIETLACRVARLELLLSAFDVAESPHNASPLEKEGNQRVRAILKDIKLDLEDHLTWAEHFKSSR